MNRVSDAKRGSIFVCAFLSISVLLWAAVSDAWGYSSRLWTDLSGNWNQYLYGYMSRLIWASPFLFLMIKERRRDAINPRQVFQFHFQWKTILPVFTFSAILVLCAMQLAHGGWWYNPDIILIQEILKYLVVGFTEELVYRGFGLNMLSSYTSGITAIVVSSLFFAALHIPAYVIHWYRGDVFQIEALVSQVVTTFVAGMILGAMFRKDKSLWPVVTIHFWYDLSYVLFVG